MADKIYKMTTVTATSTESYEQAIRNAVATSAKKVRKLSWFQVDDMRGAIGKDGTITEFQAKVIIAFEVEVD